MVASQAPEPREPEAAACKRCDLALDMADLPKRWPTRNAENITRRVYPSSVVLHKHRLILCVAPKAGSTAWRRILLRLHGERGWQEPYPLFNRYTHHPRMPMLELPIWQHLLYNESWTRIAIVREPARRLFSTYSDKVVHAGGSETFLGGMLRELNLSQTSGRSVRQELARVPFHDFVDRVGRTIEARKGIDMHWGLQAQECALDVHGDQFEVYLTPEDPAAQQDLFQCILRSIASRSLLPGQVMRMNDTFFEGVVLDNHSHAQHSADRVKSAYTAQTLAHVQALYAKDYKLVFSGSCAAARLSV